MAAPSKLLIGPLVFNRQRLQLAPSHAGPDTFIRGAFAWRPHALPVQKAQRDRELKTNKQKATKQKTTTRTTKTRTNHASPLASIWQTTVVTARSSVFGNAWILKCRLLLWYFFKSTCWGDIEKWPNLPWLALTSPWVHLTRQTDKVHPHWSSDLEVRPAELLKVCHAE